MEDDLMQSALIFLPCTESKEIQRFLILEELFCTILLTMIWEGNFIDLYQAVI